ncbi:hypothetical protein HYDPIDRAFT_115278 [Hydnomerulius pinastri MD-312]|uniref:Tim44-like domain-containing protein n=1 Tax=Hydnomerulius pinastri MD-312 TaxID=994086 RepID=A0A0C9WC68_9AGAM|nr:hypothetical protein HYDPIDRAFT_115278 [Hydnomerulius pinastri MD-312]
MYQIAQANGFPGITVKSGFKTWRRIGNVQSSSRNSLLAPFRRTALSTYQIVNSAVAKGNDKKIKEYTNGEFQAKTLQLMRRRNPRHFWTWDIVSNVSGSVLFPLKDRRAPTPVTVVSIRAADVYLEKQPPAIGHRLIIQALVKFDTTQKIDITDERGQPVPSELAEPRRVVQYLLLEKIGWYDTPWKIRDQLHRS